ncbi:MAG: MlaD family protein [Bacteroidia bacterium]
MEQTSKFKIRLGIFVAIGLTLLMVGIFYIGRQKHLFNPVFSVSTAFKNIGGLEVGSNVRFSGIKVGTVDNIRIVNDTTVHVHMIVDKDVQKFIKADSYVNINSDGLIGDKIINIGQGTGESVKDGQFLPSAEPVETDAILASLSVTGENAKVVSGQLAEILYKVNHGHGTVAKLIDDTVIAQNINQMIVNLKRGTRGLEENMEAAKHNILFRGYFRKKEAAEKEKKEQIKKGSGKKATEEKHHRTWAEARAERKEARRKKAEQKEAEKKKAEQVAAKKEKSESN